MIFYGKNRKNGVKAWENCWQAKIYFPWTIRVANIALFQAYHFLENKPYAFKFPNDFSIAIVHLRYECLQETSYSVTKRNFVVKSRLVSGILCKEKKRNMYLLTNKYSKSNQSCLIMSIFEAQNFYIGLGIAGLFSCL